MILLVDCLFIDKEELNFNQNLKLTQTKRPDENL